MSIKNAEESYARGDYAGALRAAIAAWRTTRAAVIADAIDVLSAAAAPTFTPPEERTNVGFQARWLATLAEGDPIAIGWVAETLFAKLPGSDNDQKLEAFEARLRALQKAPPDPRLGRALMALVEQGISIVRWADDKTRKTVAHLGDERTAAALDAFAPKAPDDEGKLWRAVRGRIKVAALDDRERAAWGAIGPRPDRRATGDRDALFAAALAAPDDLAAREVLADCLQGLGDPRGEFITLQLAELRGAAPVEAAKRADALLKKHKKEWLGKLASVTYRARFRGGFLDELELDGVWRATQKAWQAHARDPLLSTVRSFHGSKLTPETMALFIGSPALRALESVEVNADPIADALERAAPKTLREVRSTSWKRVAHEARFARRVVPLIEALPSVERVYLTLDTIEALEASRAWPRIRALTLDGEDKEMVALWRRLPRHVTSLTWGREAATLRREDDGALTFALTVVDDWGLDQLPGLLAALRPLEALSRVVVTAPKRHAPRDAAFAALRRAGLTVEVREPLYASGVASGLTR